MRAVYLLLGVIVTLAVGGAWLAPGWIDWSAYRPQVEKIVGDLLGAPVRIDGEISVALLPYPEVSVTRLETEGEQGLRTARRAVGSIDAGVLLSGNVALSELRLEGAELYLPVDGRVQTVLAGLPAVVRLVDAQLVVPEPSGSESGQTEIARIPATLTLRRMGAAALQSVRNDRLSIEGTIMPAGVPLTLEADIRRNGRIGLEVTGHDGAARLAVSGTLGDVGLSDGRLRFELEGEGDRDGEDSNGDNGGYDRPLGLIESDFDFEAATGRLSLYDLRARMGVVSAEGALGLALPGPSAVDGAITFGFFDLAALDLASLGAALDAISESAGRSANPELQGTEGVDDGTAPIRAALATARGILARMAALTAGADIDLLLRADRLRAGTLDIRNPNVRIGRGANGALRFDPLNASLPGNSDFSVFADLSADGTLTGEMAFLSDNFRAFLSALGVKHRRLARVEDRFLRQLSAAGKLEFGPERLAMRDALLSVDATDWTGDLELLESLSSEGWADEDAALGLWARVHTHRLDPEPYLPLLPNLRGEEGMNNALAAIRSPEANGSGGPDVMRILGPGSDIEIAMNSAVFGGVEVHDVGATFRRDSAGGYEGRVEVANVHGARLLASIEGQGRLSAFDSWRATLEADIPDPDRLAGGLARAGDGSEASDGAPRSGLVGDDGKVSPGSLDELAPIRLDATFSSRAGRLSAELDATTGVGRFNLAGGLKLESDGVGLAVSKGEFAVAGQEYAVSSGVLRYDGTGVQFDRLLMSGADIGIALDGRLDKRESGWRGRFEFGLRNLSIERFIDPEGPVRLAGALRVDGRIVAEADRLSDLPHAAVGDGRLGGAAYIRVLEGGGEGGMMRLAPFREIRARLERHFPAPGRPVDGRLLFDGPVIRIRDVTLAGKGAGARADMRLDTATERLKGRIAVTEEGEPKPYVTIDLSGPFAEPGMQIGGALVSPK